MNLGGVEAPLGPQAISGQYLGGGNPALGRIPGKIPEIPRFWHTKKVRIFGAFIKGFTCSTKYPLIPNLDALSEFLYPKCARIFSEKVRKTGLFKKLPDFPDFRRSAKESFWEILSSVLDFAVFAPNSGGYLRRIWGANFSPLLGRPAMCTAGPIYRNTHF